MELRSFVSIAILVGLASGCASRRASQPAETVTGPPEPPAFEQILVARESVGLSDVVTNLVAKGYAVIWDSPKEVAARYQVQPGQALAMTCAYLGQSKVPGRPAAATVSCRAVDLATGKKVYLGHGEAQVRAGQGYLAEAIGRALEKFPAREGKGYVLSTLHLSRRSSAPINTPPSPASRGREGASPPPPSPPS